MTDAILPASLVSGRRRLITRGLRAPGAGTVTEPKGTGGRADGRVSEASDRHSRAGRGQAGPGAWTSSVSTPPMSAGCKNAIEAPIEPCLGRASIRRTPAAPIDESAAVMSVTP